MASSSSSSWSRPLAGLAIFLTALGGHAQESAPAPLTLAAVLQRAAENNPALAAQRYAGRAAEARVEQAGLRPNPTLDLTLENFGGTGRAQGVDSLETTVQASQTFERGGKRDKRVAVASHERDAAAREFAVRQFEVLAESATAYVETLAAQQRLALATEPLALAREMLDAVEARVRAGAASPAESARARASVAAAQAEYARSQSRLTATRAILAATWGGRTADVAILSGRFSVPDLMPAEESFLPGLAQHPRLGLQQAIIASRRAALELEQAQSRQDVTVGGGVRFLSEDSDAAFVAGVSLPLPFRNKNQGNIRAARENLAGAEQSVHAIEVSLQVALAAAWQDLAAAHTAALSLRRESLPATEEAYATVRSAYDQGQLPLIDVLDAQRALVALRRDLLDAEAAYAAALARVEALTGATFPTLTALLNRS